MMLTLQGLRKNLSDIIHNIKYEQLTMENRNRLIVRIWIFRVRMLNLGLIPYIYSYDGSLAFSDIDNESQLLMFENYSIKIDSDTIIYDDISKSTLFADEDSSLVFENSTLYEGIYSGKEISTWFCYYYLMCENNITKYPNHNYQKKVLDHTFRLSNPDFHINL